MKVNTVSIPPADRPSNSGGMPPSRPKKKKQPSSRKASPQIPPNQSTSTAPAKRSIRQYRIITAARETRSLSMEDIQIYFRDAMSQALRAEESPERLYLLTVSYDYLGNPRKALECAELFMKNSPPGHPYHGLACYWLGMCRFSANHSFSEEVATLFQKAYRSGIAPAAKYLMAAHSGTQANMSLLKWFDSEEFMRIAVTYPAVQSEHFANLALGSDDTTLQKNKIKKIFHEVRYGTESFNNEPHPTAIIQFSKLLCDFFAAPDDQTQTVCIKIEDAINSFMKRWGDAEILRALYHYARCKRLKDHAESLDLLTRSTGELPCFCAARIISKNEPVDEKKCIALFTEGFKILHGYRYLADFYIGREHYESALQTYREAIRALNRFTQGTEKILDHTVGEQATKLFSKRANDEEAKLIDFEELAAVDLHIRFFQGQVDILEEVVNQNQAVAGKIAKAPLLLRLDDNSSSDSDDEFYTALTQQTEDNSDSDEYLSADEFPDDVSLDGFTTVEKKRPPKKKLTQTREFIKKSLNKANALAAARHYEDAEKMLNDLQPDATSVEWYRKSSLCAG